MKKKIVCTWRGLATVICLLLIHSSCLAQNSVGSDKLWITYKGEKGPGMGRHIVLISGDEEYRSEEALPALGRLLAEQHGFDCTVLFAIDPQSGTIDPKVSDNIPGLHLLEQADLMILFTRFRNLPAEQMKYFENYLKAGKPILALRTATHAFNFPDDSPFHKYSYNSGAPGWEGGVGKKILGETWVNHHGDHGREGTRTTRARNDHPVLIGVESIWVPTDVYTAEPPADANILLLGQPTQGMQASSPVNPEKSPMPVAWTKTYQVSDGEEGRVFTTTMGSSMDLLDENFRRLLVNATYWATGLEKQIRSNLPVDLSADYRPTMFGFDTYIKNVAPFQKK